MFTQSNLWSRLRYLGSIFLCMDIFLHKRIYQNATKLNDSLLIIVNKRTANKLLNYAKLSFNLWGQLSVSLCGTDALIKDIQTDKCTFATNFKNYTLRRSELSGVTTSRTAFINSVLLDIGLPSEKWLWHTIPLWPDVLI